MSTYTVALFAVFQGLPETRPFEEVVNERTDTSGVVAGVPPGNVDSMVAANLLRGSATLRIRLRLLVKIQFCRDIPSILQLLRSYLGSKIRKIIWV